MTYGLTTENLSGEVILSSDTYNLHYAGQPTFFSSQRFQGNPPVQFDNFFIASETAPIPFIVNRPGIFSAVVSVARSATPGNWNIVILSSGGTPNNLSPRTANAIAEWPTLVASRGGYFFSFAYDSPPTILCFTKLNSTATVSPDSWGLACWDADGKLSIDSTRKLLNPLYAVDINIPTPETSVGGIGYASQFPFFGSPPRPWIPGQFFIPDSGAWTPYNQGNVDASTTTSIGTMPTNPAYFFSSSSEIYTWAVGNGQYAGGGNFGQNKVPVFNISGANGVVRWGTRAVIQSLNPPNGGWTRLEATSPAIIIDASKYL